MAKALRENQGYNGREIVVERPDGSRVIALAHANPFHDESGRLTGAVNVVVDITEQRLLESTVRLAGIDRPKNARVMVPMTITGLGMLVLLFLFESTKQLVLPTVTIWQSHFLTILFGSSLALIVAYFVLRKQAAYYRMHVQAALLCRNERELTDFFENGPIGLHWVGPDGIILRANQAELDMLGYAREEYVGRHIANFHVDPCTIDDILGRLQAGETLHSFAARLRCKDGSIKHVVIDSNVWRTDGQFRHTRCFTRDVTDRKRAEAALSESERRFQMAFNQSYAFLGILTPDGILIEVNDAPLDASGFTREQVLGSLLWETPWWTPFPQEQALLQSDIAAAKAGCPTQRETTYATANGTARIAERTLTPIRDEAGQVVLLLASGVDVTDKRLVERRLRESNEELEMRVQKRAADLVRSEGLNTAILNSALDAIITMDHEGNVVEFNAEAEQMFGHRRDYCLGKKVADLLVPPHFRQRHVEGLRRYLATGESKLLGKRVEVTAMRSDGSEFPAEVALSRIAGAEPAMFTGCIRDVSERKKAETELRAAQRRLQDVVASSPAVLYVLAVEDGTIRGVSWMSANVRQMMGYAVEETLGMNWWMGNVHPDDREWVMARVQHELFAQAHIANEYRFRHRDGKYRWVRSDMRLLRDAAGRPVEIVGSWSDITERKELEDQYRQAQKMEGIGRLAGGVAHDFNNLLTVINGYSELLSQHPKLDESTKGLLREIHKAGKRAAGLTHQLLAFSRKQILEPKVLDLNVVLSNMEKMLHRMIGEDIEIRLLLAKELGNVKVDPGQIEQVIMNLAINARDAMPTGGTLTIRTENASLDQNYWEQHPEVRPGPYVVVSVIDTGCGMDESTKARIFEPFFTTKEQGKGTGLGLSMVYGIVKQSEGHLDVSSEVGMGTVFLVYLPRVEPPILGFKSHHGLQRMPPGTETVLLVEDEEGVRGLAIHGLLECGYTVLEARDGEEALKIAATQTETIDVLVTDVVMPRMGGRELAERVTAARPATKVLFVSGYTDDAVLRYGVLATDSALLKKPFTPAVLATKVREVLDEHGDMGEMAQP